MEEPARKIVNVFELLKGVAAGAISWNDSSVAACAGHIRQMMDGAQAREHWALMMVDASAKQPEPLLGGLRLHLGDYDQCLRARSEAFAGRYCLVSALGQRVAACVPSTCSRDSLDELLANSSAGVVRVPKLTCRSEVDSFVFHPAIAALGLVLLLAVLNALGWFLLTFEDVRRRLPLRLQPSQETATAMSPVTAWKKISGARTPLPQENGAGAAAAEEAGSAGGDAAAEGGGARAGSLGEAGGALAERVESHPEDWSWAMTRLSAASGVRTLSMVWVVLGHRAALMPQLPVLDKRHLPERMKQWVHVYVTAGLFAVDTFLFLSGCVLAFTMACRRRQAPRTWRKICAWLPSYYLHRYIRLTPLMAFMMVLYAGGLLYIGEGPLWDELSEFDVNSCRTNWWPNLLYIHNYYNNRSMCVAHSWYLAVEMQLCLISPLLVFPVVDKWTTGRLKYGRWVFAFLLTLSIVVPFALVLVYDLAPAPNPIGDQGQHLAHAELVYIPTHTRAAPWIMGVGAGAWAARVVGGRRSLGRWTRRAMWVVAAVVLLGLPLALTGALRAADDESSRWGAAFFLAFSKPFWALGLGAVVMLCTTGHAPRLNAVLSWEPLAVLSRLTFAVYLLHPVVQFVTGWSSRGTTVATDVATIPLIVSDVVLSFALALPVSILVESPFIALNGLLSRASPPRPAPGAPAGHVQAPDEPDQPHEGDTSSTACANVSDWCRERIQSFRANRRARRSRSRSGSGDGGTSRNEPTEMRVHQYSLLSNQESPLLGREESPSLAKEESPNERPLPSEQSSASAMPLASEKSNGEPQLPSRPSTSSSVERESFLSSAVSSSEERKQRPFVNGASSENLQRKPSVEEFAVEDETVRAHTPVARKSSRGTPAARGSLKNGETAEVDIATDKV